MNTRTAIVIAAGGLLGGEASAQLTYQAQARSVAATTTADGQSTTASAPDFAPFDVTVSRSVPAVVDGQNVTNQAVAAIACFLDGGGVKVRGRLSGGGRRGTTTTVAAIAVMSVNTQFTVAAPTVLNLSATALDSGTTGANSALLRITGPGGAPLFTREDSGVFAGVSQSFTLDPGVYQFEYNATITVDDLTAARDYRVNFEVPLECDADLDDGSMTGTRDGGVTIDDLMYFLDRFDVGDHHADLDDGTMTGHRDGGVTVDDLLYFLLRFDLGC